MKILLCCLEWINKPSKSNITKATSRQGKLICRCAAELDIDTKIGEIDQEETLRRSILRSRKILGLMKGMEFKIVK